MSNISSIPKRFQAGLATLISIEDSGYNSLLVALENASLVFNTKNLALQISPSVKGLNLNELRAVLSSAGSLIDLRERDEAATSEIVQDIIGIINEMESDSLPLTKETEGRFRDRLSKLLDNRQLYFASKSVDMITEYENVFVSVRIATDLRPVYDNQTNETPKAGMISHILHLHYQRGEESDHRDLYVALDSENLKYLKRMIERAEKKAESLRPIFKQSGIIELHPEE